MNTLGTLPYLNRKLKKLLQFEAAFFLLFKFGLIRLFRNMSIFIKANKKPKGSLVIPSIPNWITFMTPIS
jgi:hypothetical protein